ncbi:FtsX-like permease family protein [Catenulispora pinisilvae]|uniref:FtsX-like permease family protein n=1 Tax=Catenulispora pinisilvae TaxID=2705253 RepID=UPI001890F258|nr:FtsX-like permease family protein [Catenulispora pinisilvae]
MIWKVAVRIARREALRHKGRSALVAAMLALPVAGASAADTLYHTTKLTTVEQVRRDLGHADALVSFVAPTPIEQLPDGTVPGSAQAGGMLTGALQGVQVASPIDSGVLPAGSRVVPMPDQQELRVEAPQGADSVSVVERDLGDPLLSGLYVHKAGRAPRAAGEVTLSTSLLSALDKHIGDQLTAEFLTPGQVPDKNGQLPKHQLTIVGEDDDPAHLDADEVIAYPGTLPTPADYAGPTQWLAQIPGGLNWAQVQKLNQGGYSAESRLVVENPPPDSAVPLMQHYHAASVGSSRLTEALLAVGAVGIVMALLEVVLLAGPAFAVGARKRRRDFGLMGAAGADHRMVRAVVLADGLVLGAVGGVVGALAGIGIGRLALPEAVNFTHREPGAFRIAPGDLAGAALIGVVTGLIAALIPAVITGRQQVLESLTGGRRGARGVPWKLATLGVVVLAAGLAATGYAVFRPGIHTVPLVGGIAVSELGVVACTPLLVALTGKLGRLLPLTGRMALRDSARNRGRTAPAVAAILAAVAGSTAVATLLTTNDAQGRAQYHSTLRTGQVALMFGAAAQQQEEQQSGAGLRYNGAPTGPDLTPVDAAKAIAAISAVLPVRSAAVIPTQNYNGFVPVSIVVKRNPANDCPFFNGNGGAVLLPPGQSGESMIQSDPRCQAAFGGSQVVPGDAATLRALTGTVDPRAEKVLAAGGMVVFSPFDLTGTAPQNSTDSQNGTGQATGTQTATIALQRNCPPAGMDLPDELRKQFAPYCSGPPPADLTLPAAVAKTKDGSAVNGVRALIPQSAADKYQVKYVPSMILFDTTRMPTKAEEERANAAAESLGTTALLEVERGYQGGDDTTMLALAAVAAFVTLGAAAISTGLAITDGQADLETLAAVGARPRMRRTLAGSQATITAVLGTVLGSATGLVPAVAIVEARSHSFVQSALQGRSGHGLRGLIGGAPTVHAQSYLTIPWPFLIGTIVIVPMLAGIAAALVTRSKIEIRRRRG